MPIKLDIEWTENVIEIMESLNYGPDFLRGIRFTFLLGFRYSLHEKWFQYKMSFISCVEIQHKKNDIKLDLEFEKYHLHWCFRFINLYNLLSMFLNTL